MRVIEAQWFLFLAPHDHLAFQAKADERQASVVEDVPADGAPALLIVENEFTGGGRQVHPLPLPFLGPSSGSVVGWLPDGHQGAGRFIVTNVLPCTSDSQESLRTSNLLKDPSPGRIVMD
jgi:hypothetical protein